MLTLDTNMIKHTNTQIKLIKYSKKPHTGQIAAIINTLVLLISPEIGSSTPLPEPKYIATVTDILVKNKTLLQI